MKQNHRLQLVFIFLLGYFCVYWSTQTFSKEVARPLHIVSRVIDGDTIILDGNEKIRLIGVDCPELHHPNKPVQFFAKEAAVFVNKIALGKKVYLEYDQTRYDRYGRTLAYVFLESGLFLNAEIIKQGFGFAYTKYPFIYLEQFRRYERVAREKGVGLWK